MATISILYVLAKLFSNPAGDERPAQSPVPSGGHSKDEVDTPMLPGIKDTALH